MEFSHYIPNIHLGPVKGTSITHALPLNDMSKMITKNKATFEVNREIYSEGKSIYKEQSSLEYLNGDWVDKNAEIFSWTNKLDNNKLCYLETTINLSVGVINGSRLPGFYVFYNNNLKSYLSCGADKYGSPRVIMQLQDFGYWVDGYPCINIDKNLDTTYSVVIINPYNRTTKIDIEIADLDIAHTIKVKPKSVKYLDFSKLIKSDKWNGQVYLYGEQRAINYFINHKISCFYDITTIEHPDPFRSENTFQPRFQKYRSQIHQYIKNNRK